MINRIVKLNPSADNWKTFIFYEKYFGDVESIRKAYKRSLEYCKEEKDYFSENWIMFEKMYLVINNKYLILNLDSEQ